MAKKVGSIEWLSSHVDELLQELRQLDVFVPERDETADLEVSNGGKGASEKRRMRGNTKATKKSMKAMHTHLLERRSAQLQLLVEAARAAETAKLQSASHRRRSKKNCGED